MNTLRGCKQLGRPEDHPPTRGEFIMIKFRDSQMIRRSYCEEVYTHAHPKSI